MKFILSLILLMGIAMSTMAANQFDQAADRAAIKSMTGCYDVTFRSKETFAYSRDYSYYPAYASGALEWIFVDEESADKIVLQHLLITPEGIVKHWRQDWVFEPTELLTFQGDNQWRKVALDPAKVTEQWSQQVYQVDDSPRYECSAPWVHWGEQKYWECEAPTPLPRREFSVRSDYNILQRQNRHQVSGASWVHDQDNIKIKRELGVDRKIAMEKTINTYLKTTEQKCSSAAQWWSEHAGFWRVVRTVWDEVRAGGDELNFRSSVNGMNLWMTLFVLDDEATRNTWSSAEIKKQARQTIENFLK